MIENFLRSVAGKTFVKFLVVGGVTTLFDLLFFGLLVRYFSLSILTANITSYGTAVLLSFVLNRAWTFRISQIGGSLKLQALRFAASNLAGLALSTLTVHLLSNFLADIIAKILSIPVILVWNYTMARRWVFNPPGQQGMTKE